ncbi:hypothetical protein BB561_003346 [Smittium simulii]|uniref:Proteasome maturation factor UMP1 n=1 Tax=Smittium simulii TaxID=133385 RepID=A0A2T9YLU9_9FUNG|nr:hypothetical protein BB561_003346 [Smittium simulii]
MSESNALNDYGVHDTMRYGPRRLEHELSNTSEFETHLKNLRVSELEKRLALERTAFGSHMALRTLMDLHSVSRPPRPEFMAPVSNIHLDILSRNDETITHHNVFKGITEKELPDAHSSIINNRRL